MITYCRVSLVAKESPYSKPLTLNPKERDIFLGPSSKKEDMKVHSVDNDSSVDDDSSSSSSDEEDGRVTLGEMVLEIRNEKDNELNMPARLRGMLEQQLIIYMNFLEKRRNESGTSTWIRDAISEILIEAKKVREKRPEIIEEEVEIDRKEEEAILERNEVLECARQFCQLAATDSAEIKLDFLYSAT